MSQTARLEAYFPERQLCWPGSGLAGINVGWQARSTSAGGPGSMSAGRAKPPASRQMRWSRLSNRRRRQFMVVSCCGTNWEFPFRASDFLPCIPAILIAPSVTREILLTLLNFGRQSRCISHSRFIRFVVACATERKTSHAESPPWIVEPHHWGTRSLVNGQGCWSTCMPGRSAAPQRWVNSEAIQQSGPQIWRKARKQLSGSVT